jgi:hypothetical protein
MSMTLWGACPACARHVRLDESACPFCRAELPASFSEQRPLAAAARKLNRAALYALRMGAASATAVATAACSSGSSGGTQNDSGAIVDASGDAQGDAEPADAPQDALDDFQAVALYGGFVGVDAAYGGLFIDAGPPDGDASSAADGSLDDDAGG